MEPNERTKTFEKWTGPPSCDAVTFSVARNHSQDEERSKRPVEPAEEEEEKEERRRRPISEFFESLADARGGQSSRRTRSQLAPKSHMREKKKRHEKKKKTRVVCERREENSRIFVLPSQTPGVGELLPRSIVLPFLSCAPRRLAVIVVLLSRPVGWVWCIEIIVPLGPRANCIKTVRRDEGVEENQLMAATESRQIVSFRVELVTTVCVGGRFFAVMQWISCSHPRIEFTIGAEQRNNSIDG